MPNVYLSVVLLFYLEFLSPSSSSPALYSWLLELSGSLSDANWWVNRSGVSSPSTPLSWLHTNVCTHTHIYKYTAPWNLLQDQMAGNACPPSPAEPWCALWWLRLLFKPSGGSYTHTHTRTDTHSLLVSPAHPPPAFTPQTAGQQENTHTHTQRNRQTRSL